jgi:hypothetical protein
MTVNLNNTTMKPILLPALMMLLIASACKKERTCTCTITEYNGPYMTKGQTVKTAKKKTKKDFKEDSHCYNSVATKANQNDPTIQVSTETNCTLK